MFRADRGGNTELAKQTHRESTAAGLAQLPVASVLIASCSPGSGHFSLWTSAWSGFLLTLAGGGEARLRPRHFACGPSPHILHGVLRVLGGLSLRSVGGRCPPYAFIRGIRAIFFRPVVHYVEQGSLCVVSVLTEGFWAMVIPAGIMEAGQGEKTSSGSSRAGVRVWMRADQAAPGKRKMGPVVPLVVAARIMFPRVSPSRRVCDLPSAV